MRRATPSRLELGASPPASAAIAPTRRAPFAIEYWPELFKCVQGQGCSFSRRNDTGTAAEAQCIVNHTGIYCANGTLLLFPNGTEPDPVADSIWNLFGVLG